MIKQHHTTDISIKNLCTMLMLIVAKVAPKESIGDLPKFLSARAEAFDRTVLFDKSGDLRKYLELKAKPKKEIIKRYIDWINHELNLNVVDLSMSFSIPVELHDDFISLCRKSFSQNFIEVNNPKAMLFYQIHIDKHWKNKSIAYLDLAEKRNNERLPNFLLYQAYGAAMGWDEVTKSRNYSLPKYCREGLEAILKSQTWRTLASSPAAFFELGTGAPIKTNLILEELKNTELFHEYVIVDASTPMLEHNVTQIRTANFPKIRITPVATDFEQADELLYFFQTYVSSTKSSKKRKCFFILGFTLANLDEVDFFKRYKNICSSGDIVIFPIQFIPSQFRENLNSIKDSGYYNDLIAAYSSPEGKALVQIGLGQIRGLTCTPTPLPPRIDVMLGIPSDESIGGAVIITYYAELSYYDSNRQTHYTKQIEVIRATRFFEEDYFYFLKRQGFEIKEIAQTSSDTKTLLIQRI